MDLLLLLFGAFAELGPPVLEPNLDAGRVELRLVGKLLAPVHVRVVRPVEGGLELVQLARRERGPVAFGAHRVEEDQVVLLVRVLQFCELAHFINLTIVLTVILTIIFKVIFEVIFEVILMIILAT